MTNLGKALTTMTKAKITPAGLARFMGLKKGHGKTLAPFCDAARDICNAFAGEELADSHSATQAMQLCAAWLMATGNTEVDQFKGLPLQIRYFVIDAKA